MSDIVKTFPGVKALDGASLIYIKEELWLLWGKMCWKINTDKGYDWNIQHGQWKFVCWKSKVDFRNVNDSQEKGIAVIHQD